MGDGLHIKLIQGNENQSKFDPSFGSLVLNKAGAFQVTVKEYEDKRKPIDSASQKADKKARERWNERAKAGWTKEKLQENWEANQDLIKKEKDDSSDTLVTEFKEVNWIWVVAAKQLNKAELSHNESFSKGISGSGIYNIHFPKVLEGGGIAYLEAFLPVDGVKASKPFGVFVQATGAPKIVRVEWTDFDYNPLDKKLVSFYSEVLLHIYTESLYGQELDIELLDEDTISSNDKLNISGKKSFKREVDIHKVHPKEIGKVGVADSLVKSEQNKTDNKIDKEQYVQKTTIEVYVDPNWKDDGGNTLKIYPTIKSLKTGKYFENFTPAYLNVSEDGNFYNTPKDVSNMPAVQSNINTNIASYHPCFYSGIELNIIPETEKEKNRIIFKENNVEEVSFLYSIPIICADTDHFKDYSIELIDLDTKECRFDLTISDHEKTSITVIKTPENYKITNNNGKFINFKAAFNYHPSNDNIVEMTSFKMLEYIWPINLPKDNNHALELRALSCRYEKGIKILAYPDVKWTLDFRFGMKGPEQYTSTNMPNYDRTNDPKKPKSRRLEANKKATTATKIRKYGMGKKNGDGMELEFQLVLKAEYNKGEEIELAEKYADKIKKFLNLLLLLKEGLDLLTGIDKVNSGHKSAVQSLGKIGGKLFKSPIVGSIDYPGISIGGKWQAAINEETNEVYTDGKLMLRLFPLLKGDVSLDIIAAVSYVPAFGQAVKAIEIALNTAGAELNFMLTIFGQVNGEIEYALAEKGGSNVNLNGELGIKLVLSGKIKKDFSAVIFEKDIGFKAELSAEGYVVSSIKPKLSIGHDKKGSFIEPKCDFMGINIVVILVAKIDDSVTQYKDTYNILKRKDDFLNGKGYYLES